MSLRASHRSVLEAVRLEECVLEPIHTPGAIQPHGVMVIFDLESFTVLQVSDNCAQFFGLTVDDALGKPLAELVGPSEIDQFRDVLNREGFGSNPVKVMIKQVPFNAIVHDSNGLGVVEFEPRYSTRQVHSANTIYEAIHRLARATTVDDLLAWASRELRNLTNFDQVMIYKFHPDKHGEVVAESCAPGIQPRLGHHFPESDIPDQARRLYLKKMSRVIVSSDVPNAQFVPAENPVTHQPVDLSLAELRAISPRHIQFMRNMGQASTMSFSLVEDGELIGMITCADRTVMHIPYALRRGYEVLARQVALQWRAMERIERLQRRETLRQVRQRLAELASSTTNIGEALTSGELTILDLVQADGGAVRLSGLTSTVGDTENVDSVQAFFDRVQASGEKVLLSESLPREHPHLAETMSSVAGVLVVQFGGPGNYLAWFRREQAHSIMWLGDQSPENRNTPLSPRNSFEAWSETVSGTSLPWDDEELVEAAELSLDVGFTSTKRA